MEQNTLQSKLEESLRKFKSNIAIQDDTRTLTYGEVDKKSNYIANWIAAKGIEKGTFVGILSDHRMDMITAILGVVKAGCVFIPLDPAYPPDRIKVMIETTDIGVVIIDKINEERLAAPGIAFREGIEFFRIHDLFLNGESGWFDQKPNVLYSPEDKIYIYFTSGTTGTPKAILGKNSGLIHFINWEINNFHIDERFRFSQFTNPGFDVFLRDILVPLCAGAAICIPDYREVLLDSQRLTSWIAHNNIDLIHCVPSLFRLFNADSSLKEKKPFINLKYILFAGERVNPLELKKWYDHNGEQTQLVNLYGPTETTLAKVFHLIRRSDAGKKIVPIGKPIDGARVIILDQDMDICDELVTGELYIRTPYRSFGYYNDPKLNRQKFLPNPFSNNPNDIIYKTGDLGRFLPDGNIELTGRVDRQVKIRGQRIELEEIETLLQQHPDVKEASVIKKEMSNGNASLFAFTVPQETDGKVKDSFIQDIKEYLSNKLPYYMVPASITKLEEIPRKPNLKVDFDVLSGLPGGEEKEHIPPRDDIKKKLAETWSQVLGIKKIGITDNFFERGGNSLNVMTLIAKIDRIFDIKMSLGEMFNNLTIEMQAAIVKNARKGEYRFIEPVEKRDYYALSSAQKRLYVLQQMDLESKEYNLPDVTVLIGEIDRRRVESVIRKLIHRHESLRTSFQVVDDRAVQQVHQEVEFKIEFYDLATEDTENTGGTIKNFIRPFDLSQAPLLRVGLIKLEQGKHIFIYDMHHIITDGVSQQLLKNDFMALYQGKALPPLKIRYRDYSEWQNRQKQREAIKRQEEYWLKEFQGDIPILNLPTDYVRPVVHSFEGSTINFEIIHEDIERLKTLALEEDTTLYMVLLAIYNVFLGRISNQEEIVVGTPTAGRIHEDLGKIIGMFVNTLALKTSPVGEKTSREFLEEIKEKTLGAFENQGYQFEDLVNRLTLSRDVSRHPMFDVMFVFQDIEALMGKAADAEITGLSSLPWEYRENTSKFDLTLKIIESEEKTGFGFEYCTKLFKEETIDRFITYFRSILAGVLKDKNQRISAIDIIPAKEKQEILFELDNSTSGYPYEKTIHRLFEEQVEKWPDGTAIVCTLHGEEETGAGGRFIVSVTYNQLNRKSDRLAHRLKEKGVVPDIIVGIMVERSVEMIVGILGILKAGGAYLPIEPDYPEDRKQYMLNDSGARIPLTSQEIEDFSSPQAFRTRPQGSPSFGISPRQGGQLAYIIYTSGTTGRPKGALIEHRNVVRLLFNEKFQFDFNREDVWTLFHSYCFDFSVWEIYGALLYGGELIVIPGMVARDPGKFLTLLKEKKVTILNQTPSAFYHLINEEIKHPQRELNLKYVIFGGEALKPVKLAQWRAKYPGTKLINMFGITETTVHVTYKEITGIEIESNISNIGKPIPTLSAWIMDGNQVLLPPGVPGELCVGGEGLGRGYLNRVELTSEKFIENPYRPGEKMYRSGDLAKSGKNFEIEYLGRIDNQVKIRGFRVELGEIECRLLKHEKIKEAVVLAKEDQTRDKYLCAYIVSGEKLTVSGLREFLARDLPGYMVPHYFIVVQDFPLTTNGKINWKALDEPGETAVGSDIEYAAPRSDIEKKLVETWQHVLGRDIIGIDDNFFELGGDSIKTIQIASRMSKAGYTFNLRDIFLNPQIAKLAPLVKKIGRIADQSVITGPVPLTPIQEWFFRDSPVDNHHFNQAVLLYIEERLEPGAAKAIFSKLQEHHDALRMTFIMSTAKIIQTNHGLDYPLWLEEYDLRTHDNAVETLEKKVNEIQASIHLGKGPLMKVGLFHLDDGDRLLIVIHHLVVDGVSWRILIEDIETLYRQYKKAEPLALPLKTDSYKRWAEKLPEYANSQSSSAERAYWARLEAVEPEPIKKDFPVEENYIKDVETLSFQLDQEQTQLLLTRVNHAFGTGINDILLTALGLGIKEAWGYNRCLIALEGHGREEILKDIDINRTIGWFTSVYPVILAMSYENDLSRQVKEVKESLHQVPHRGIGYGILKYLTAREHNRGGGLTLEPQVSFNYLGQFDTDLAQTSFKAAPETAGIWQSPERQRKYELEVFGIITNNRLELAVAFNKKQYKKETIKTLISYYQKELTRVISYCSARKEKEYTPSDFSYKKLSIETLDRLSAQYGYTIEDIYILTPMQEGMLFHTLYDKEGAAYFEQTSYRLQGDLEVETVRKSFNELLKRYDILRTAFIYEGKGIERPIQSVLKDREIDFLYEDIRGLGVENGKDKREIYIEEFKEKDRQRSFDLSKDVLMRQAILQVDDRGYEFVWSHHHILMDGWCTGILIAEFFEIYNSYLENRPYRLSPVQPFRTYIHWLEKQDRDESGRFWKKYLEDYLQMASIPNINISRPGKDYKNENLSLMLGKEETQHLNRLAARNSVTLNTIIQAVWGIILAKYNGQPDVDVVFGAVVSGRTPEIENVESMVGLFINTIPIRIRCEEKTPFNELLHRVQEAAIESEPHHYYPLAEIQSAHDLKQNLLDHILIFENYPIAEQIDGIMNENREDNINRESKWKAANINRFEQTNYYFNVVVGAGEQLQVIFSYNANIYECDWVKRIAVNFEKVLQQVINNPELGIKTVTILSEEEKQQVLFEFNNTQTDYPKHKTIYQLFEEQVAQTPDGVSVIGPDSKSVTSKNELYIQLTYRELNKRANQLAWVLTERGVKPDNIVGIMIKHSLEMIIGILGVWKAGGAYLPIDLGNPEERILYMLENSAVDIIISDENQYDQGKNRIGIDILNDSIYERDITNPEIANQPFHAAYVIYTSGSTGKPKGVIVEHRNLTNTLFHRKEEYGMDSDSISLQLFSCSFDGFLTSFFTPIISGAKVVLLSIKGIKDLASIKEAVVNQKVTHFISIPSLYEAIMEKLTGREAASLKTVTLAGEKLLPHILEITKQKNKNLEIVNEYGVTEAAVMSTIYRHQERDKHIKIGQPIWNTKIYILDNRQCLQSIGIVGELGIAGAGAARGYLNRPEFTKERFQEDPFETGNKMYLTGDLARWLPGGTIEFLGRRDHQVKIRGFRIEAGEIENQLLSHPEITGALVMPGETPEGKREEYLCAYIVTQREFEVSELRKFLSHTLPNHMIPSYFISIDKIPLTPSGKIDRKALLKNGSTLGTGIEYVEPGNELEKMIAHAWKDVLKKDKVGIHDNFFDIGGDSLKAIRLNSRLNDLLNKKLSIVVLFDHVTIHSFIQYLNCEETSAGISKRRMHRSEVMDKVKKTRADRRMKRRGGNGNEGK